MSGNQSGFTLLELLVGLAVLGLLYVLLFDGLQGSVLGWRRIDAQIGAVQKRDAVADFLRQTIRRTAPEMTGPPAGRRMDFDGRADRMEFLAPLPERFGVADIVRWQLFLDGGDLVVTWQLDRQSGQSFPAETPARTLLLKEAGAIAIRYFGRDRADAANQWREDWWDRTSLPLLIRIRLADRDDLTIALQLTEAADCPFDAADLQACPAR